MGDVRQEYMQQEQEEWQHGLGGVGDTPLQLELQRALIRERSGCATVCQLAACMFKQHPTPVLLQFRWTPDACQVLWSVVSPWREGW
jgi:hypothetical protein